MYVKMSRNEPCPCGSGKKYKKCCGQHKLQPPAVSAEAVPPADMRELLSLINARRYRELESRAGELSVQHPDSGAVWKALAFALGMQGKPALQALARAAALLPNDAEAHNDLGNALLDLGRLEEAVARYSRVIEINPNFAIAHNNLGSALRELGILDGAESSYRRALALKADYADAHNNLGTVLRLQKRFAEAAASGRMALTINPNSAAAMAILAEIHADQGEFAEAEILFKRAIAKEPDHVKAYAGFASLRKMTANDAAWFTEAQRIAALPRPPQQEVHLRYAIGKYYDDLNEFEQAFTNYRRANELTKLYRGKYDRERLTLAVDATVRHYDRQWVRRSRTHATSSRPIFIVGMPRSGTSLAEQILASHPAVFGAGELPYWTYASATHQSALGPLHEDVVEMLSQNYLRLLDDISPDTRRVIDKTPTNFLYLGMIHAALPKARIIHMRRHPIDTCLSIYFQNFNTGHPYTKDLGDLAHFYAEYRRLMRHWRDALPEETMLEVPYESLVDEPETWSRAMLEFIDLPWDARCLDFHLTRRAVITASRWQVKQQIGKSSVGRWRNYEKFVGPLLKLTEGSV